jgi:hypothetical protein
VSRGDMGTLSSYGWALTVLHYLQVWNLIIQTRDVRTRMKCTRDFGGQPTSMSECIWPTTCAQIVLCEKEITPPLPPPPPSCAVCVRPAGASGPDGP